MEAMGPQQNPAPGPEEAAIDLRAYLAIILKRKWAILAVFLAAVFGTAAYTLRQTPTFASEATIVIDLEPPQVLGEGVREAVDLGAGYYYTNTREFYETQYKVIGSRSIAERVAERLGLDRNPEYLGVAQLPKEQQAEHMGSKAAAAMIQASTSVLPLKDSRVVRIHVEDRNAERAAAIANEIANTYMQSNLERRMDGSKDASVWLQNQLSDLKGKLSESELALHQFKRYNDLVDASFENRQTMVGQKVATLSDSLTRVQSRRAEIEAQGFRVSPSCTRRTRTATPMARTRRRNASRASSHSSITATTVVSRSRRSKSAGPIDSKGGAGDGSRQARTSRMLSK
jgi:uncharacterized protein involved in exopolysaccharide biosynthesis